jgi:hypothetical protein
MGRNSCACMVTREGARYAATRKPIASNGRYDKGGYA